MPEATRNAQALKLLWCDLEMTGLEVESCAIVEIGLIVTGADLLPVAEFQRVIWQPEDVLARMAPVVRDMHTKSGLLERIRQSRQSLADVEREALAFIAPHARPGEFTLAGNSIHVDRRFLMRYMPAFERQLHYRQVDVSSIKLLARAWYGDVSHFDKPDKDHTALADLRQSLAELAHYRATIFRQP